ALSKPRFFVRIDFDLLAIWKDGGLAVPERLLEPLRQASRAASQENHHVISFPVSVFQDISVRVIDDFVCHRPLISVTDKDINDSDEYVKEHTGVEAYDVVVLVGSRPTRMTQGFKQPFWHGKATVFPNGQI
ncbi:MAG: hypothetical protein SGCHY_005062, partial [Lobulomycetales sp.]